MGGVLNSCPQYASDTLTFDSAVNIDGWVLDLGFVPTFFLMYYAGATEDLSAQMRVVSVMCSRLVYSSSGARSTLTRGVHVANYASTGPRLYSYSSTGTVEPYDEGGVQGVIGQGGTGTTIYRLIGTYRYIALG